ncbi:hypothetical protein EMCRGX_G012736 [Ephydatia muelleri]
MTNVTQMVVASDDITTAFIGITLLQSKGPALGIQCEVFSSHSLDLFPPGMISTDKPNLVILGAPIGNKKFCSSKGLKNVAGLWSQLEEVGLIDPQVALILLRLCGAFCKLVHLTHATPTSLIKNALAVFDAGVRRTFCLCTGVDASNDAWQQAQLSLGKGGLGCLKVVAWFRYLRGSLCPGRGLDHLSHHAVTCKRGGDVVTRHNRLRDCIGEVCRRAHIGVQVEVGNNLTPSHSKTRPADILIPNWVMGRTAALDVSVTSPLNPQILLEAGVTATAAVLTTEERKHDENDPKCSELGWVCIPVVAESYGAWGREA